MHWFKSGSKARILFIRSKSTIIYFTTYISVYLLNIDKIEWTLQCNIAQRKKKINSHVCIIKLEITWRIIDHVLSPFSTWRQHMFVAFCDSLSNLQRSCNEDCIMLITISFIASALGLISPRIEPSSRQVYYKFPA